MEHLPIDRYVRIRSFRNNYLFASTDKVSICQGGDRDSPGAVWKLEYSERENFFRLKSHYCRYLGVSEARSLLGLAGREVIQKFYTPGDTSIDWKPARFVLDYVILTTDDNKPLRANSGLFPFNGSVTKGGYEAFLIDDWFLWRIHEVVPDPRSNNGLPHGEQVVVFEVATNFDALIIVHEKTSIVYEGPTAEELAWALEATAGFKNLVICTWNDQHRHLHQLRRLPNEPIIEVTAVLASPAGGSILDALDPEHLVTIPCKRDEFRLPTRSTMIRIPGGNRSFITSNHPSAATLNFL